MKGNLASLWFQTACKNHDICYSLQKLSQYDCDFQLFLNMEYSCKYTANKFPLMIKIIMYKPAIIDG